MQAPEDVDLMDLMAADQPSESIEDLVARNDQIRASSAPWRCCEEQRTAIVLKEYHGLTFQEIADLVGCPLSTVNALISGALGAAPGTGKRRTANQRDQPCMRRLHRLDGRRAML